VWYTDEWRDRQTDKQRPKIVALPLSAMDSASIIIIVPDIAMSVSVCLFVRWHMSLTTRSNFTDFSADASSGRGSLVPLRRRCNMYFRSCR